MWAAESFLAFGCMEMPPKKKWYPKGKVKVDVLNSSDKVRFWGLLKGGISLVDVALWGKWNQCHTELYLYWAFVVFSSAAVSLEPYTQRYQGSTL